MISSHPCRMAVVSRKAARCNQSLWVPAAKGGFCEGSCRRVTCSFFHPKSCVMRLIRFLLFLLIFIPGQPTFSQDTLIFIDSSLRVGYVEEYRENGILFTELDESASYLFSYRSVEEIRLAPDSPLAKEHIHPAGWNTAVTAGGQTSRASYDVWIRTGSRAAQKGRLLEVNEEGVVWYSGYFPQDRPPDYSRAFLIRSEFIKEIQYRPKGAGVAAALAGVGVAGLVMLASGITSNDSQSGNGAERISGLFQGIGMGGLAITLGTGVAALIYSKKKIRIGGSDRVFQQKRPALEGLVEWQ